MVTLTFALLLLGAEEPSSSTDFFEKKIRPVLVERCYSCHSSRSEKPKSGLRLDSREGILKGGSRGPALVPGNAEKSLILKALRQEDPDLKMPPKGKLSDEVIADFALWIDGGAPDPRVEGPGGPSKAAVAPGTGTPGIDWAKARQFWSLQPPRDQPLPEVKLKDWPQTPIDFFILSKLEEKGMKPSAPADRRTLIRRVTLDLIGLPPTPEEVEAFEKDDAPNAYRDLVERLLASPRHGERWGRYWLDVARYSDTKGYVYDREERRFIHSHVYRDWVIRAFNHDLPYDQFLLEQLAADRLVDPSPGGDRSSLAAMGFLTLGRRFLGVVHDIIDDRIDTVFRGMQGLTVACARCHDHKFDPIPTRDYYSLYGVFHASTEAAISLVERPERTKEYLAYEEELRKREEALEKTFQKKREELCARLRAKAADYLSAVLDAEKLPTEEFYALLGPDDLNPVVVRQWQAYLFQARKGFHPVFAPWHALSDLPAKDFAARAQGVLEELGAEKLASGPGSPRRINSLVALAFQGSAPGSMREVAERYGKLFARVDQAWRKNVEAASKNGAPLAATLPDPAEEAIRQALYGPDSPATVPPGAINEVEWFFDEPTRVELAKLQAQIEAWKITSPGAPPHAVILADRPEEKNPRVFLRGNPANRGEEVPRRWLEALSGPERKPFQEGSGRLDLARAIASKENPLTARVMVNRIWLHHFGAGIVRTPSDFGKRCDPPSHRELLDYLARRFMDEGWSIKKIHRLILLSSAYRQASAGNPEYQRLDPEDRLLWRMNRERLDFEALRDSLLAVTGELDEAMGGPAVDLLARPFSARRTVYGLVDRQFLPGVFRAFDFANPDQHSPQRYTTTVPQQALFLMNSPFVVERARALTRRLDGEEWKESAQRLRRLYRLLYQREPTGQQMEAGLRFVQTARADPAPPPSPTQAAWQYGYGEYDEGAKRIKAFAPLPHFTGEAWQGGPAWPDPKLGWAQITAKGGHAGNDPAHAAIRRWLAPRDGTVSIAGAVAHSHKEGDGIEARIVSSRSGLLGHWALHNQKAEAAIEPIEVLAGDSLDFVVDLRANLTWDAFDWAPVIRMKDQEWRAERDFAGPPPEPLTPWEEYAQALLLANELVFVD